MVVGGLLNPAGRYMEGMGKSTVVNKTLGITCEMDFTTRGYISNYYTNRVESVIKDPTGVEKYRLDGYYTSELIATNIETQESWVIFKAPQFPEGNKDWFYFNSFSLQLNQLSDSLKSKLPPSDSRLRPDMRAFEEQDIDTSQSFKDMMEKNQADRR